MKKCAGGRQSLPQLPLLSLYIDLLSPKFSSRFSLSSKTPTERARSPSRDFMRFILSPLALLRNPNPSLFSFNSLSPIRSRFSFLNRDRDLLRSVAPLSPKLGSSTLSSSMATEEGSAARRFWQNSYKESVFAAYTPFVVCLAAGSLEIQAFREYIVQDAHFLRAFAKAYEMAAEYADDDDAKAGILDLRKAALEELKLHDSLLKEWGVDPSKEISPNPATVKYTDFVLATAKGKVEGGKGLIATPFEKTKIAAYAIGAMSPCMRLYANLGKELRAFLPNDGSEHLYKRWIDNYSSENFEAAAVQIEELLDKLSVPLTGEELDLIEKLYRQAMKLEIEFFTAQPIAQPAVVPVTKLQAPTDRLYIYSDFDLTCTVIDSSAILAEIAILTALKVDQGGVDAKKVSSDMRSSWDALSSQYTEEYEQCIEGLLPKEEVKEFDYEGLYKSLEQLAEFEKRANSRVIESGMLRGLNFDDIKRAGELLALHDGCKDFFQKMVKKKEILEVDLHILSYCWCADLIRSSFSSVGCLSDITIHSNEFKFEESISTGEIDIKIESPLDKVDAFSNILDANASSGKHLSVYIGDSVGDMLCLLKADIGIVVGSSASLRRVGKHFNVSFVPLYPGVVAKQRQLAGEGSSAWKGLSGILYTVSNWSEIQAFILGA